MLTIHVHLMNEAGEGTWYYVDAETVDEAVAIAVRHVREDTDDDTWEMNDWQSA